MEQALNTKDSANYQNVWPFLYPRIDDSGGAAMMTCFPIFIFVFLTFLGLVGCDTHSEHVWDEVAHQVPQPKVEQATQAGQPAAVLVNLDSLTREEPVVDPVPAESQNGSPALQPSFLGRYLTLDS